MSFRIKSQTFALLDLMNFYVYQNFKEKDKFV